MPRLLVTALLLVLLGPHARLSAQTPARPPDFVDENMITHGPILGRIESRSIGVWARTLRAGAFTVLYGTSPQQLDQVAGPVTTTLAHDNTGWIRLTGLAPNTRYWYEVKIPESNGRTGRGGSFRTLPEPDQFRHPEYNPRGLFNFSFEFACGNNQNPRHSIGPALPTFRTMLREIASDIHFAILNGDWLYEVRREYTPEQWAGQVGIDGSQIPAVLKAAPTLTGVWENYKFFLAQGEPLSHWHREVPSFFTYDDHECLNDIWGAGSPGLRDRRAVFRDIGVRAWYDYLGWSNPVEGSSEVLISQGRMSAGRDTLVDESVDFTRLKLGEHTNLHVHWGTPTAGVNDNALDDIDNGAPNSRVYRIEKVLGPHELQVWPAATADGDVAYSIGKRSYFRTRISNCDFFVLDTRGQRQMHDTANPASPSVSMLGEAQRDWLLQGVTQSDADFLFVVSSVNFMIPHVGGGAIRGTNKDDAWTVFLHERELLIETFDKLRQPVFVLTGDLHNSFAIAITDNVFEFASGPHNSVNHIAGDEGDRPPNGPFQYGPRPVDILWSTWYLNDIERHHLLHPNYCVVQVNNVINNPQVTGQASGNSADRWVAYPRPQVVFQYYDGRTGKLKFAHSVRAQ
jgi:phosphodiesterase/alkaline phosphatase D-like protein